MKFVWLIFLFLISLSSMAVELCSKSINDKLKASFLEIQQSARELSDSKTLGIDGAKSLYQRSVDLAKRLNEDGNTYLPHFVMAKHYYYRQFITGTSGDPYLSAKKFAEKKVSFKDGKAYDSKGKLLDTGDSLHIYFIFNGELFVAQEKRYKKDGRKETIKHATLGMGVPVSSAGEIAFQNGMLTKINGDSGRYRTPKFLLYGNLLLLEKEGLEIPEALKEKYSKKDIRIFSDTKNNLEQLGLVLPKKFLEKYKEDYKAYAARLKEWSRQEFKNEDQVWEVYDEIMLEGRSPKALESIKLNVVFRTIKASVRLGFRSDYLYELSYLLPFLNYKMFVKEFTKLKKQEYFDYKTEDKIQKILDKTKYVEEIQNW